MPPRTPLKRPQRSNGNDPTVSIATAATARNNLTTNPEMQELQTEPQEKTNDDLKKLIETLKNKLGNNTNAPPQKKAPPTPKGKSPWNRSIEGKETKTSWKPAYTILTRISNHEKVPVKSTKSQELTINSVPHSFLYRPGVDGIKIGKLDIKAGKQVGIG